MAPSDATSSRLLDNNAPTAAWAWPELGENKAPVAAQGLGFAQNPQGVLRQWHAMRLALFHPCRRYRPDCAVKVDFAPFSLPDFARSLEHMRAEAKR